MIDGNLDVEQSKLIVVTADRSNARGIVSGLDIWTPTHEKDGLCLKKSIPSSTVNAGGSMRD
jgi:hypothetical protein